MRGPRLRKIPNLRPAKRLARKYSIGFLVVVLVSISVWYVVTGGNHRHGGGFLAQRFDTEPKFRRLVDPPDQFTQEQRRNGAVILHALGLLYMFVAIAIVCDECFVPSLEVISEVLNLSPDVAGATFMAAGGSAPEFFTSLIGAMITQSDIGTGTIIGSAVFNVLFVIGACALVAPEPLHLTWFPLARDSCFYAVDLVVVTCTFLDEKVKWYEALFLFCCYVAYTVFMVFSERVEAWTKTFKGNEGSEGEGKEEPAAVLGGGGGTGELEDGPDDRWADSIQSRGDAKQTSSAKTQPEEHKETSTPASSGTAVGAAGTGQTGSAGTGEGGDRDVRHILVRTNTRGSHRGSAGEERPFRHKSMRMASHPKDHASPEGGRPKDEHGLDACVEERYESGVGGSTGGSGDFPVSSAPQTPAGGSTPRQNDWELTEVVPQGQLKASHSEQNPCSTQASIGGSEDAEVAEDEEEENEPLSVAPPALDAGIKEWVTYLIPLPIVVCLVCTVPDVRRDGFRKYFAATFFIAICWIAFFTWVMVWFATAIGETCGLKDHIMGLTILAAGTSVPDLLTSMIVARQGHGDMAISSSIGSNIFDVTVGLPVPWMLYAAIRSGEHVTIKNEALEICVMLLLGMLGFTIVTIVTHSWVMTKWMGSTMIFLYLLFEVVSVGLADAPAGSLKLIHV